MASKMNHKTHHSSTNNDNCEKPHKPGQVEAWQLALQNTKERLQYLYVSGQHSDLEIVLSGHKETFKVHRLVLAMSSPVFEAMVMGSLAVRKVLTLHKDSPRAIRKLLEYIYTDCLDLVSVDEALEVYAAAHKYQLDAAQTHCSKYIVNNLTEDKTLAALEASLLYEDSEMNSICEEMLVFNPEEVLGSHCVAMLKKETVRRLLQRQDLEVSEVVLFNAVIAWGKAQLCHREEECCGRTLRRETEDLLKEVRFLAMSCEEFIDNVIGANVLSCRESIQILKCIRGCHISTVPKSTPLNPSAISREGVLFKADLGEIGKCEETHRYEAGSSYLLLSEIKPTEDISVHQIEADIPGVTLNVYEKSGCVCTPVGESSLNNRVTSFREPVVMEKDKVYMIEGTFRYDYIVPYTSDCQNFTCTVGDMLSISYKSKEKMNFKFYFKVL